VSSTVAASPTTDRGRHDWDALFPPDPDLMASAEGDTKGLAAVKKAARERIDRRKRK
jgi:hypothetical protein